MLSGMRKVGQCRHGCSRAAARCAVNLDYQFGRLIVSQGAWETPRTETLINNSSSPGCTLASCTRADGQGHEPGGAGLHDATMQPLAVSAGCAGAACAAADVLPRPGCS